MERPEPVVAVMAAQLPILRPELRFTRRERGGRVLIEDPLGGAFLETDIDTATFARLLDGTRSAEEAAALLIAKRPATTFTRADVAPLVDELRREGMLLGDRAGPPVSGGQRRIGPISQRLRLGSGDRFFAFWARHLHWLYSIPVAVLLVALIVVGIAELVSVWSPFFGELHSLLSLDLVVLLWAAWFVSKVWHEFQHGVVARLYGVEVREYGLLFILLVPLGAYVDVTGAWRLENRWKRLHITMAGIVGEFALGAVAILLWSRAPDGDWKTFLQALVVATLFSSVIFNANPLMRFDGYYAISDLSGVTNLYQRGSKATRDVILRWLTGVSSQGEATGVLVYGWMARCWRLVLAATIAIAAAHLAFGFGLLLAAIVVWTMIIAPMGWYAKAVWNLGTQARRTAAIRLSGAAACIAAAFFLPVPTWISAPGIVVHANHTEIRAGASGTVVAVLITEGDVVRAGDALVELANPSLSAERRKLSAKFELARLELQAAIAEGNPAVEQDKREVLGSAAQQLAETERQVAMLTVVAPRGGVAFGNAFHELRGQWIERGDLVSELGDRSAVEVRAWLTPDDIEILRASVPPLAFRSTAPEARSEPVMLTRIDPASSHELPPAAVTADGGGPLAIDVSGSDRKLAESRFGATLAPSGDAAVWYPGTPGWLSSDVVWRPLGQILNEKFSRIDFLDPSKWTLGS